MSSITGKRSSFALPISFFQPSPQNFKPGSPSESSPPTALQDSHYRNETSRVSLAEPSHHSRESSRVSFVQQTHTRQKHRHRQSRPSISGASGVADERRRQSVVIPVQMVDLFSKSMAHMNFSDSMRAREDAEYVIQTIESLPSAREQVVEMNAFGSRAVFMQSFYYTLAFYVTFTFATANRIIQQLTGNTYFPVIFLHSLFIPLQGFFNRKLSVWVLGGFKEQRILIFLFDTFCIC
jgi:hypothetical protein